MNLFDHVFLTIATQTLRQFRREIGDGDMKKFTLLILFVLTFFPLLSKADRYELLKGQGVEVCEAYQKNLNSFDSLTPMVCERKINPQFKDFTKPTWKRIDATTGVMLKIDEFLWKRDANPIYYVLPNEWPNWRGTKEQYAEAKRYYEIDRERRFEIGHLISKVDIDNDGIPENVYLDRACGGTFGALLLTLNSDQTDIDYEKTQLVMRHPSRADQRIGELRPLAKGEPQRADIKGFDYVPVEDSLHRAIYDVFLYKNVTYFDLWWVLGPSYKEGKPYHETSPLRVFSAKNGKAQEVCTYRVVPTITKH